MQRHWLGLDSSSPTERTRREFTCSSSQAEKRRPVAFTAAEQYHSWLPSWQESLLLSRLFTIPTPPNHPPRRFFLYVPILHMVSICILLASLTPSLWFLAIMQPGNEHPLLSFFCCCCCCRCYCCRCSFSETHVNTNRRRSQQTQVVAAHIRQKRPDPENQMESCQAESGAPAAAGLSRWRQG